MNILFICNKSPYPPKDGGAIATWSMVTGLATNNYKLHVLAINTHKHPINEAEVQQKTRSVCEFTTVSVNTNISFIKLLINFLFSSQPYNALRFKSKKFNDILQKILNQNTYDIIQLEGLYLSHYISTIRNLSKAKIVLRAHNIEHEIWQRLQNQEKNILKKIYLKNLTKRLRKWEIIQWNNVDAIVPISERDTKIIKRNTLNVSIHTSSTGIDLKTLIPKHNTIEPWSLFFIGALDWFPNQEGLLWFITNCWKPLKKDIPRLKFYIAGRNAPEWLHKIIVQHKISFLGEIDDAYSFMQRKKLMIAPLFSGSGIRIKILEGMALEKIIITTTIGAEGIDCLHGENILIADTTTEFITTIKEYINNDAHCAIIATNARKLIEKKYNNEIIINELKHFYSSELLKISN